MTAELTPFTFVDSICVTKQDLMDTPSAEKAYVPFIVNRSLSNFADTARLANKTNYMHTADNVMQYKFLLHTVPKRRRIAKWHKRAVSDSIDVVRQYYMCSYREAEEYVSLLTPDQIDGLRQRMFTGGAVRHGATKQ